MSLGSRVCTAIFAPMPFSAAWEVALHAAVDGQPPALLVAAGGVPMLATVAALVVILADEFGGVRSAPAPQQVRRQVAAARRKELAR